MFSCGMCEYTSKRRYDVGRHQNAVHGYDKFKSKRLEEEDLESTLWKIMKTFYEVDSKSSHFESKLRHVT